MEDAIRPRYQVLDGVHIGAIVPRVSWPGLLHPNVFGRRPRTRVRGMVSVEYGVALVSAQKLGVSGVVELPCLGIPWSEGGDIQLGIESFDRHSIAQVSDVVQVG